MMKFLIKFEIVFRSGAHITFDSCSVFETREEAQEVIDDNIMMFNQIMCSIDAHEGFKVDNRIIQILDVSMINQTIVDFF